MRSIQKITLSELLIALATLEPGSPLHVETPRDIQVLQLEHVGFLCSRANPEQDYASPPTDPNSFKTEGKNLSWNLKYS